MAPFARKFPSARVWTAPAQWSWPLNLPPQLFGIFPAGNLENDDVSTPWAGEISQKVLFSPEVGIGPYVEVAFFHRPSRTLLVTDCVILIPKDPLPIIRKESLVDAAQNGLAVRVLSAGQEISTEPVEDSPQARATGGQEGEKLESVPRRYRHTETNRDTIPPPLHSCGHTPTPTVTRHPSPPPPTLLIPVPPGWQRMVLQILYFGPSDLLNPSASFSEVAGRLIVSPVIRTLVFNKVPQTVRRGAKFGFTNSACRAIERLVVCGGCDS